MKDIRLFLYFSRDIQERFCHLIQVSLSLGNPYIACCPPSLMVSGGLYAITFKFKPMPRFELGTSSLPRRHTAGLCHIGNRYAATMKGAVKSMHPLIGCALPLNHQGRLPRYIVGYSYKILRKTDRNHWINHFILNRVFHVRGDQTKPSNRRMLVFTPSNVATSITGTTPLLFTACMTALKSIVPSPTAICASTVPSLS